MARFERLCKPPVLSKGWKLHWARHWRSFHALFSFTVAPSLQACYEEKNPFSSLVTQSTLRLVLKALAMAFTSRRTLEPNHCCGKSRCSEREDGLWPRERRAGLTGLIHVDVEAQRSTYSIGSGSEGQRRTEEVLIGEGSLVRDRLCRARDEAGTR
jgi:hypothetical protein